MENEKTLVLIKPDGVKRSIIGKIITRFEDSGLKIIALKMLQANEELTKKHYKLDEEWAKKMFDRTKKAYEDAGKKFEYKDYMEYGSTIRSWNMEFLREGPVIAIVLEGPHAIELVRKMVGHTEPRQALPGTIRGDFASVESYSIADTQKRVLRNLIHASDSIDNANHEISLWFNPQELISNRKSIHELIMDN